MDLQKTELFLKESGFKTSRQLLKQLSSTFQVRNKAVKVEKLNFREFILENLSLF